MSEMEFFTDGIRGMIVGSVVAKQRFFRYCVRFLKMFKDYSNAPRIPPRRAGRCERRSEEPKSSGTKIGKHGPQRSPRIGEIAPKIF